MTEWAGGRRGILRERRVGSCRLWGEVFQVVGVCAGGLVWLWGRSPRVPRARRGRARIRCPGVMGRCGGSGG